ncbi:hypothetical protein Lal_00014582, partial [Lupinus albus]
VGGFEAGTLVFVEPTLKYHPLFTWSLTSTEGHCVVGSLTGVVASKRVTEAFKGTLSTLGCLTVRPTSRSGAKAGHSDPVVPYGRAIAHRIKVSPKSSHRRGGSAPRCRLVTSWGWRRSQGLGCSPIKVARELGSERRETVRSLSIAGVRIREDRVEQTSGVSVVPPGAPLSSYCETRREMRLLLRVVGDDDVDRLQRGSPVPIPNTEVKPSSADGTANAGE